MNREIRDEWVKELRSGKYKQGQHALRSTDDKYCCLGILCEIAVDKNIIPKPSAENGDTYVYVDNTAYLPDDVAAWAGIERHGIFPTRAGSNGMLSLSGENDRGLPFNDIANLIEREF